MSDLKSSAQMLKSTIDNRFVRFVLRHLVRRCKRDGESSLGVALELFSGVRENACFLCSHVALPLVRWTVGRGGGAFGVSEDVLKSRFKDRYWRTGLVDVIKGIAKYGVR